MSDADYDRSSFIRAEDTDRDFLAGSLPCCAHLANRDICKQHYFGTWLKS